MGELTILTEIGFLAVEALTLCDWHKSNAAEDMLSFPHSMEILVRRLSEAATKCAYHKECPRCHRRREHNLDSDEVTELAKKCRAILVRSISCAVQRNRLQQLPVLNAREAGSPFTCSAVPAYARSGQLRHHCTDGKRSSTMHLSTSCCRNYAAARPQSKDVDVMVSARTRAAGDGGFSESLE